MKLEQRASAKINLGLHVLGRRADGYHEIETVLLRIPWADQLQAEPADSFEFTCSDPNLPTDARNLCVQAAHLLRETYGVESGAKLHLQKRLPYGAGLGGGSSDAAATLLLLADLWGLEVSKQDLMELGAQLGADVPFFLGTGAAYATGIGTTLEPLEGEGGEAYAFPFVLVVVAPEVAVSTPEAYGWVQPSSTERTDLRGLVQSNDLGRWQAQLINDFERPVMERFPAVSALRELLQESGARYVSLSGSGAAVYGVFEDAGRASAAAEAARQSGHRVWHGAVEE